MYMSVVSDINTPLLDLFSLADDLMFSRGKNHGNFPSESASSFIPIQPFT